MEKMRDSTGIILWVLIFSFGILWMLQDTQVFNAMGRAPSSLGSVNGEPISYEAFQGRVNLYSRRYSQRTGNSTTPAMRAFYEDQAWNQLVTGKLLQQKMDQLGIVVTDQEVVEMIRGENPVPFIQKRFGNEDGTINRAALNAAINAEQNSQVWIAIEQQLRAQRRRQKLNSFIQSGMQVTDYEVQQSYIRANTTADIKYVRFPYAAISEEDVEVTEEELRNYYEEHQDQFKQEESYGFSYVTFSKAPTAQDTARTIQRLKDLRDDFASAENDSLFLNRYQSAIPYNPVFVDKSEIKPIFEPVLSLEEGEVSQLIKDNGQLYLLKKLDETSDQVKFTILSFRIKADPIATIDKRARQAGDFKFFATQEGFINEAKRRGLEVQEASGTKGTFFIPGLGQSRQVLDFLESAEEGDISEPIETANQFIVLKVTNVTPEGVRPFEEVKAQIENIVFSNERKEMLAQRVSNLLQSNNNLQGLAEASGNEVVMVENLPLSSETIAGAGREPKVVGAVFGLETGEVSQPIKGTTAVFVIKVTERNSADTSEITPAIAQKIRQRLQRQKATAFTSVWLDQLKEQAEIEDYRNLVLR